MISKEWRQLTAESARQQRVRGSRECEAAEGTRAFDPDDGDGDGDDDSDSLKRRGGTCGAKQGEQTKQNIRCTTKNAHVGGRAHTSFVSCLGAGSTAAPTCECQRQADQSE